MAELRILILTFNCGLAFINVEAFASQIFSTLTSPTLPDVLVLSLQEIAPIPHSLIGGSFLAPYFERFHYAVQKAARKISSASDDAPIYNPVVTRNLGMTGLMIFAKDASAIQDLETGGVGVGLWQMGNKGAVGVRFAYKANGLSTELTFVAAHLAAMEDALKQRNEDWKSIARGLVFSSTSPQPNKDSTSLSNEERPLLSISSRDATIFKPTSHLFLAGDLNYRTYQLNKERLAGRTCHGLIEAPVTFPPTYKYDHKGPFNTLDEDPTRWQWARHRWPSWCDRILYLDAPSWLKRNIPEARITVKKYSALPLLSTSDHRAVVLELSVPLIPIPSPDVDEEGDDPRIRPPFEVDINWKSKRDRARLLELIVGFAMYLSTTSAGGSVVLAMAVGGAGAFFAIRVIMEL